ncbi:MAG: RdgB/HAM1 family non-canonical purine NTP pyrophosphatase [Pseudomonadota bacterium]
MSGAEQELVVATGNAGKVAEFQRLLTGLPYRLRLQSELNVIPAEETGLTFVENALLKARAAAEQTGFPALADDSGLEVDALNGAPGVRSARYAADAPSYASNEYTRFGKDLGNCDGKGHGKDTANNARLLWELRDVPESQRTARFHCVIVLLRHPHDPVPFVAHGSWEGRILNAPIGSAGFGYDPLFYDQTQQLSAAQMSPEVKNRISHRGQAVQAMLSFLRGQENA